MNDATNLIVLDTGTVQDAAGNVGASIAISNNYALDASRPTVSIAVANPNMGAGQSTVVTFTFSEAVSNFDLSDLSVTNGDLTNLSSSDGGKTWTATFTPAANVSDPSNFIALDTSNVTDLAGNAGDSVSVSNNYAIGIVSVTADPQIISSDPVTVADQPNVPLQPIVFTPPTGDLGSPLTFAPLFEDRVIGNGIRPLGDIFMNNGALAQSFIAQVFSSSESGGDGAGHGFLGFGGGDGGVFSTSTLSSLFNQDVGNERDSLNSFGSHSIKASDVSQGLRGVFGAPSLVQQLQQLKDTEQRQVNDLATALKQAGISEMQA
jgi:hypothetical protein